MSSQNNQGQQLNNALQPQVFNPENSNSNDILRNVQNGQKANFFKKILNIFEINDENSAFNAIIYWIVKIYGLLLALDATFYFRLSYLIILISLLISDVISMAKEINNFWKEL